MEEQLRKILGLPYKSMYDYWRHYWSHYIDMLIDKDNISIKIEGPRLLLRDLLEELEGHGLSNQSNIAYFQTKISEFDKLDKAFYSLCHPIIACLLSKLQDKNNTGSSMILCKRAIEELVEKHYFTHLVDWLAETISEMTENTSENRKKINSITQLVIAEYVAEGFVLEEIKKYATDILDVVLAEGCRVMAAPSEFDGLKEDGFNTREEYYRAVSANIQKWDIHKCIGVLKQHYYATPQNAYFIVRLTELKGEINDYIGDINIYSPKVRQYITSEFKFTDIEKVTEGRDFVNAAIPIDYTSLGRAKVYAKAKLEDIIDILTLTYRTKIPIKMANNIYAVVIGGREVSMSISVRGNDPQMASRDEMMRYIDSLDLKDIQVESFKYISDKNKILESASVVLRRRLRNSARWYSKAVSVENDEDRLLYNWFAIEGVLKVDNHTKTEVVDKNKDASTLNIIQEFASSIISQSYFHNLLRDTYNKFLFYTNQFNNFYDLSDEAVIKAALNLKIGDKYRDYDFINAVPELIDYVNDDIVKDELSALRDFYRDEVGIKEKSKQLRDDILLIYRLRNMIVHNAALSCGNINFYAREANYIAKRIIQHVIQNCGQEKTINDIVLETTLNFQVFMDNFKSELTALKSEEKC